MRPKLAMTSSATHMPWRFCCILLAILSHSCYAKPLADYGAAASTPLSAAATSLLNTGTHNTPASARNNNRHGLAGLLAYPGMSATSANMNSAYGGSVAFQPHNSIEETNERAVYDPGDELLRALNAEFAANGQELGTLPEEPDYADTVFNELEVASKYDVFRKLEDDLREEQEIVDKSTILMKLIEDPTIETLPIVYVEEDAMVDAEPNPNELLGNGNGIAKRGRYYRRYPWKRHNRNRSTYEPELRYACTPTKDDVMKLLMNLHENRKGNHSKTVNFCNRKRPAKAIFTNIRFLG